MKTSSRKILSRTFGGLLLLLATFVVLTYMRQRRSFEAPTPALRASHDPAVIERGRYLVQGPAHCAGCHGAVQDGSTEKDGPLSGGFAFRLPVGTFRVPNITPDARTGIGRYSDADIARILRYGVRPDGRAVLPFMPFANLSDQDLVAIISYLRAQEPVHHEVAAHETNLLGKLIVAWVLEPKGPTEPPPASSLADASAARGRYLAHSVANCVGCHTTTDMRTGAFTGPLFGGGAVHAALGDPTQKFVAPNLTPDPRYGWISGWSEETFVARMKRGALRDGSPMPWTEFSTLTESDALALYRYLRTVRAASTGPDPQIANSILVGSAP